MSSAAPSDIGLLLDALSKEEAELLLLRAARHARQNQVSAVENQDAVIFERGELRFGILVAELRAIRPLRFSHVHDDAHGVPSEFYYRGETLKAYDLLRFLRPSALPRSVAPRWVLILERQGVQHSERVGLVSDNIVCIESVALKRLEPLPTALGPHRACFHGVIAGSALLLNPAQLLTTQTFIAP